ncbi:transposase [Weissella cibaria]|nr:transposase [Weissella cibaria]MCT0953072.1 hypothetical protein [Weissella cibaria]
MEKRSPGLIHELISTYKPIGSTMGKIEDINLRIKQITRTAHGYQNIVKYMRRIRFQMKYGKF